MRENILLVVFLALLALDTQGDEICIICRELLGGNKQAIWCNHEFHSQCISQWLQTHNSCPICRSPRPQTVQEHTENTVTVEIQFLNDGTVIITEEDSMTIIIELPETD